MFYVISRLMRFYLQICVNLLSTFEISYLIFTVLKMSGFYSKNLNYFDTSIQRDSQESENYNENDKNILVNNQSNHVDIDHLNNIQTQNSHAESNISINTTFRNNIQLNSMPWFHGNITRNRAENLLKPRSDGLFLIRESTNFPGDYALCVCCKNKVEHYRVKYQNNKLTIDDEEFFNDFTELIEHYQNDADGLCTQLTKYLPKLHMISEQDLKLGELIGKGEFGEVLLGYFRDERVAVKMLKYSIDVDLKFLAEADLMKSLKHDNLVKLLGVVCSKDHICLVTEYMSKGSLLDYLRSRGRLHVTEQDQINFAWDACSGMEYLERNHVVHRDLAARNVLIAETGSAKVSDFGLAWNEQSTLECSKLPIKWTAPEALKYNPLNEVVKYVEKGCIMEKPEGCPTAIYEIMKLTWELQPEKRPTFNDVKNILTKLKTLLIK